MARPRRAGRRLTVGVIGAAFAGAAVLAAGCSAGSDTARANGAGGGAAAGSEMLGDTTYPARDARLTACAPDASGQARATVVVTNHSEIMSDYMIDVRMIARRSGAEFGGGDVAIGSLRAGQPSRPLTVDSDARAPAGGYTCRLVQVNKFVSTG